MWIDSQPNAARTLALAFVFLATGSAARAATPVTAADLAACDSLLARYLTAVAAGDPVAAAACWRRVDRNGAARLGIAYTDTPLKIDGEAPLWRTSRLLSTMPSRRERPVLVADGTVRLPVVFGTGADTARFTWQCAREDDRWRLASPVVLACEAATATGTTGCVRLHVHSGHAGDRVSVAPVAAALDSCVADMLERLAVAAPDRERIARGKLGYLLVPPSTVAELAGTPTVGVANLQQDVVVTSHPCHAHELAHLVLNAWLRELPLYMLPLLQEGVAVQLGGRWGRHRRVLERVGRTTLHEGWLSLDDLLTRDGFHAQPPDLSYGPAGAFAGFVLETYGPDGLHRACLAAAGTAAEVAGWDADTVKRRLAAALGTDWPSLAAAFARHVAAPVTSGIVAGTAPSLAETTTRSRTDGLRVNVGVAGAHVDVTVTPVAGQAPAGALLFGGGDAAAAPNPLFAEHFPGRLYRGESHALLISDDEAKLYDYRLQMLVALHAEGFWPAEAWRDEGTGDIRFLVEERLWPTGEWTLVGAANQ